MSEFNIPKDDQIRVQFTIAIGDCMQAWAGVEIQLRLLFSLVVNSAYGPNVSHALWESIVNFRDKKKALDALIDMRVRDPNLRSIWAKLSNKISTKATKRNEVAHGIFLYRNEKPVFSFKDLADEQTNLDLKQLTERCDSFHSLRKAVEWFQGQMHLQLGYKPVFPTQEPDLIKEFQRQIAQTREDNAQPRQSSPP